MNDPRSPEEPKTRIPTVGDLAEEVARSRFIPPERRSELFHAARQVCAEELRMVRTGFAPAPLDDLAARVVRLLPAEMGGERYPGWSWDQDAPFPDEPWDDSVPAFSPDDPFGGAFQAVPSAPPAKHPAAGAEREVAGGAETPDEDERRPVADEETPVEDEETPVEDEETEEEPEVAFALREQTPAPPRGGKLAAFLLFIAIAGGVYFFSQTKRPAPPSTIPPGSNGSVETSPFPAAPPVKAAAPVVSAPTPAPPAASGSGAASAPAPAPSVAAPNPGSSVPESRGAAMISPDWAGHPAAFMIHFSSYQKKENADRDAARLAKLLGRPLHVIGVNLGTSGYWYRVMLGEFRSREEADAARGELVAKGTPGMGLIYRVSAFPADRVSDLPSGADPASPSPAG